MAQCTYALPVLFFFFTAAPEKQPSGLTAVFPPLCLFSQQLTDPTAFQVAKRLPAFPKLGSGTPAGPQFCYLEENEEVAEGHFLYPVHCSSTADGTLSFSKATSDPAFSQEMVARIGNSKYHTNAITIKM